MLAALSDTIEHRWHTRCETGFDSSSKTLHVVADPDVLVELVTYLIHDAHYRFACIIAEERGAYLDLRYVLFDTNNLGWVQVVVSAPATSPTFPSITHEVHAADWQEREIEDLFGIVFSGHPRLGDFVLHDDRWQEGLMPMRKRFPVDSIYPHRDANLDWRPRRVLKAPGAFDLPIGPIYAGVTESALFLLETVGEDVVRAFPRLFYKYRAIEKLAETRSAADALLLAERCDGTSAVGNALAFCQSIEKIASVAVPVRAQALRVLVAELERLRHHAAAIREICESTSLSVATSQAAIIEEQLLRLCGQLFEHRYLFGVIVVGGLGVDLDVDRIGLLRARVRECARSLDELLRMLSVSSSFLDRLERVGVVDTNRADAFGLVGPVGRASGVSSDLRQLQPYCGYERYKFDVAGQDAGDGYARLQVLFAEANQAARIIDQVIDTLPNGPIRTGYQLAEGAALGWAEAPRGATYHWIRLHSGGQVERYRLSTPSFSNWHGFHLAAEDFAFQDFPIILASFGLSVAGNDR